MGKVRSLVGDDLKAKAVTQSAGRQRGSVPSGDLVPLQFKMPKEFVTQFKQEALNRDVKLNELFSQAFHALLKA